VRREMGFRQMKNFRLLTAIAIAILPSAAYAQSQQGVIPGFIAPAGIDGCPSSSPCFVPYSATYPLPTTPSGSGTGNVNITQVGGNAVLTGAGATGTGSQRTTVAQDATTVAGSAPGTAGTPSTNVVSVQGVSGGTPQPVTSSPGSRTIVPLDVSTVTTGGTAVTALTAGHRTAGGFLLNPIGATINLCINEQGTASGTTSSGALTCIVPGQTYNLTPAAGAVSVITSDSSHPFSGQGLN